MASKKQPVVNTVCPECEVTLPTRQGYTIHRQRVHGYVVKTKECTRCHIEKPVEHFGLNTKSRHRRSWCNACRSQEPKQARTESVIRRDRAAHARRTFGLTLEEYDSTVLRLREKQGEKCAICEEVKPLYVDHDHGTGAVRWLLCHHCNAGLGHFRDRPELLRKAASLLDEISRT